MGRSIGRGEGWHCLVQTVIFVPSWSSCFGSEEFRFMGRDLIWGGKWWHCLVHQSFSSILTPFLWFFLHSQNHCLFACPDWGWKGWKTITFFGKMSGKRLENNPQNWWFLAGFFFTDLWQPCKAWHMCSMAPTQCGTYRAWHIWGPPHKVPRHVGKFEKVLGNCYSQFLF